MTKSRLFLENFVVYGLGGVISRIIPLLMIPVIARLMPDSTYFGIYDLSNTIISFGTSIAIMGMYDAMFRVFFDKEEMIFKKKVCSTTLVIVTISSIVVSALVILMRNLFAREVFRNQSLSYVVLLSAAAILTTSTNSIVSAPTRMQNKRKVFLVTNTIIPAISYGISIPLILRGHYIIALPLASLLSGFIRELSFVAMNQSWFRLHLVDTALIKPVFKIALPLLPNFLIYWIFNSSDKLMITWMKDVGAEGIYSIGAKLGYASQLIYSAFAGGWQYFAFSTMKDDGQVRTTSRIFEYLGVISFSATIIICVIARPLYRLLFVGDYVEGYIVSPYLFLAPLLLMLYQVEGSQLIVIKKTWPMPFILGGGAVCNVLLNLVLIPKVGIEGAAIATLLGYVVSIIVCTIVLLHMKQIEVSNRFLAAVAIIIAFFVLWRFMQDVTMLHQIVLMAAALILYALLYKNEASHILMRLKKK